MATTVHFVGLGQVALDWDGRVTNVQHLRIAHGRRVFINWHAHTAGTGNGKYQFIDKDGSFTFSTAEFGSGTVIDYPEPMGVHFTTGFLVLMVLTEISFEDFELFISLIELYIEKL